MNDFFQRILFNQYLVEQQVCGMFYRIGQRIFASEIIGLNQHQAQLEVEQHMHKPQKPSSPIIYIYPKGTLTGAKTSSSHGKQRFLCIQKSISRWEWRMELALPRGIFGGTYGWGTKLPQQFSEAHGWTFDPLGRAANSSLWRLHKLWWKNQLQTPFVRNRSLSVLMGARNTMKWKQCIASSMCIDIFGAYIYIYIYIFQIHIYTHVMLIDYFAILCFIETCKYIIPINLALNVYPNPSPARQVLPSPPRFMALANGFGQLHWFGPVADLIDDLFW